MYLFYLNCVCIIEYFVVVKVFMVLLVILIVFIGFCFVKMIENFENFVWLFYVILFK